MGQSKRPLFGVDYLDPNKVTEKELMEYCAKHRIPDLVNWRIYGPIKRSIGYM